MSRLLKPSAFKIALLIGLFFAAEHVLRTAVGVRLPFLDLLEDKALDVKFQVRGPLPLSHQVALVAIDEKAIQRYGRWPWSRDLMARGIDNLFKAGAASVALDMNFTDPDRNPAFAALQELQQHLGPLDPALDGRGQALAGQAPAALREDVLRFAKAVEEERGRVRSAQERLSQVLTETPDRALARVVADHSEYLVLGVNALSGPDLEKVSPELRDAWDRELAPSLVPGAYKLRVGAKSGKPRPAPLPLKAPQVGVESFNQIEAWLPDIGKQGKHFAYYSIAPDLDGTMRRYSPVVRYRDGLIPSLGLAAAAARYHSGFWPLQDAAPLANQLDGVAIFNDKDYVVAPVEPFEGRMLVNFIADEGSWHSADERGPDGKPACAGVTCDRVSMADVIGGTLDPASVEDKVVFLGVTALGTFDQRVTPLDNFVPGVFVHMNVAEDIVSGRFLEHPGYLTLLEAALLLVLAVALGLAVPRLPFGVQLATFPVGSAVYLFGNYQAFKGGTQLFTVTPVVELALTTFGLIFFQYVSADREKRQIRSAFQHYLTGSVMEEMLKDPSKLKLGGQKREMTVFFSDIRGFTTLSEMLQPDEVSKMLNEYLTPMTDLVFDAQGTLDKYMGDAIMAFWGAPLDQPDHAIRACRTSLAMLKRLDEMRAVWKAQGKPDIDIGIGLNTGMISVGNMGSNRLFNYTVIGDDVNLASRLEGTNKNYGTRIILGENTFKAVQGQVVARELGGVMVKGKKKPVTIYELRGMGQPSPEEAATIALFEKGLAAYRARAWDEAEACFKGVQEKWPGDGPSEKYLDDLEDKRQHPPAEGWDGVYVMKTK